MGKKIYIVDLTDIEKVYLHNIISKGKHSAQKIKRANCLLEANNGMSDSEIAKIFKTSIPTIERLRKRFVEEGLESSLNNKPKKPKERKLDGEGEAKLISLACSDAPDGYSKWTLELLSDELVKLKVVDSIAKETVRLTLKKMNLSRGR